MEKQRLAEKNLLGISWESKWDIKAPAAERVSHREMSDASKSLLASIFETVQDNHLLIARPSAWADIEISKRAEKVNADCRMDVNSLILRIDCDYCEREDNLTTLVVSAEPNGPSGMPAVEPLVYFLVNRADESGRQDGIGEFRRIYKDWNVVDVTVTAPETCGVWEFVEWIDQDGRRLTPSTTLDVGSFWGGEHEYLVRARYEYDGPLPAPMDFDRDFSVQTDSRQ